jgi:hypothetical protein
VPRALPILFCLLLGCLPARAEPADTTLLPQSDPISLRVAVRAAAIRHGLPPQIADAVAQVESGYASGAVGDVGEVGLMQVRPSTARMMGFSGTPDELFTPKTNIRYGVTYLSQAWKLSGEDLCTTVMKYRAGHGETRFSYKSVDYCRRVRKILAAQGYPVRGELPKATFGEPGGIGGAGGDRLVILRRGGKGHRVRAMINWGTYHKRIKEIEARVPDSSLVIMR